MPAHLLFSVFPSSVLSVSSVVSAPVSTAFFSSANSAPLAISALILALSSAFDFQLLTLNSSCSSLTPIIPALTAHPPVSPIIPALTQNRGRGVSSSQNSHLHNSFVFLYSVNYMLIYMSNHIVSAPTFWSAAAGRRFSVGTVPRYDSFGRNGWHRKSGSKLPHSKIYATSGVLGFARNSVPMEIRPITAGPDSSGAPIAMMAAAQRIALATNTATSCPRRMTMSVCATREPLSGRVVRTALRYSTHLPSSLLQEDGTFHTEVTEIGTQRAQR